MSNFDESIKQQYGTGGLGELILSGLRTQGKNSESFRPQDLAAVDQFHTGGRAATMELAQLAKVRAGAKVLDVGGGLGGSARVLATEFGCDVKVLDITREFVDVGEMLTARTQLERSVHFQVGSALDIPFGDESFEMVWSQHALMNIEDKGRLFGEIYRVLRPRGRYVLHEFMAGDAQPIYFPVPWARTPDISFLETPEEARERIKGWGFRELVWQDESSKGVSWFRERAAATEEGKMPPLGLHLVMGDMYASAIRNLHRNLQEGRLKVVRGVFEKG